MSENAAEMPRYRSHRCVWALKIASVQTSSIAPTETLLIPQEKGYEPVLVDAKYVAAHRPVIGGYYVVYDDGFKTFIPGKAFEEGYTRITGPAPDAG